MFDLVDFGTYCVEVRCWYRQSAYLEVGSYVPLLDGKNTYSVVLSDGSFIHVERNLIASHSKLSLNYPQFSDDGFDIETTGCLVCAGAIGELDHFGIAKTFKLSKDLVCPTHRTREAGHIVRFLTK